MLTLSSSFSAVQTYCPVSAARTRLIRRVPLILLDLLPGNESTIRDHVTFGVGKAKALQLICTSVNSVFDTNFGGLMVKTGSPR